MPQYLQTLIQSTPAKTFLESRSVKVVHFDLRTGVKRGMHEGRATIDLSWKTSGSGKPHACEMRFYADEVGRGEPVWVKCDCGDFTFRLEYALAEKKSSTVTQARPNPPSHTNPKMKTRLCKHLLKIIQVLPMVQTYIRQGKLT